MSSNSFLSQIYFDNSLMSYLIFFLTVIVFLILAKMLYYFSKKHLKKTSKNKESKFWNVFIDMMEKPLIVLLFLVGINFAWSFLSFPNYPLISQYFSGIMYVALALGIAWFVSKLINSLIENYFIPFKEENNIGLDDHLLPIIRKFILAIVFGITVITILGRFGLEIGPLLAGLGIGGLALALASKDIVSNLFGSATVLFDKPFVIGDRIRFSGYDGFVKEIGVRNTQIETFEGTFVYIPNSKFTHTEVENVTRWWARRVNMTIGLTYGMDSQKVKKAKELIKEAIFSEEGTSKDQYLINFTEFGDFSKNILVIYWITDKPKYFEILDRINIKIMESFEENGIEFAFPTQTIELVK